MLNRFFAILFIGFFWPSSYGQQDTLMVKMDSSFLERKTIKDSAIDVFKNDQDFNYEEVVREESTWWISFKNWISNGLLRLFQWLFGDEKASGFLNNFFQLLPYLLLGIVIFILFKFFVGMNVRTLSHKQRQKPVVGISEEEYIIKTENIDQLIKSALEQGNYKLAIRYYYLQLLQLLIENGHIVWEVQKTNNDYLNELKQKDLKPSFAYITKLYDYIWYGDFPMGTSEYVKAEQAFKALKNKLAYEQ